MNVIYREIGPDNRVDAVSLCLLLNQHCADLDPDRYRAGTERENTLDGLFGVIAYADDIAIGLADGYIMGTMAMRVVPTVVLANLFVIDSYRQSGVGSELFKRFKLLAKERGACAISVGVMLSNTTALQFYSRQRCIAREVTMESSI